VLTDSIHGVVVKKYILLFCNRTEASYTVANSTLLKLESDFAFEILVRYFLNTDRMFPTTKQSFISGGKGQMA
jgi:hypothetical protein